MLPMRAGFGFILRLAGMMGLVSLSGLSMHLQAGTFDSNDGAGQIKTIWQVDMAEEEFDLEYKGGAVSVQDSSMVVVLGKRPALSMSGPQTFAVRTLDASGKIVTETSLEELASAAGLPQAPDKFIDLTVRDDGNAVLLAGGHDRLFIIVFDARTHGIKLAKSLDAFGPDLRLSKTLPVPGRALLLIGSRAGRGTVIRLDRNLAKVWEKTATAGNISVYRDGIVLRDESLILTGSRSASPENLREISSFIALFDANGNSIKSVSLPGYSSALAATPGGGCAVLQELFTGKGTDIWLRSYDRDLNETWGINLLTGGKDYQMFHLAPIPQAATDYMIVGSEKRALWLARVQIGKSVLWTRNFTDASRKFQDLVWNFSIVPSGKTLLVPSTELVVNANMQQRQIVKIMSLETP